MSNVPQNPSSAAAARVLLVDDDRELCQMLTEYLNAEHFEVRSVHDGAQALTEVRSKGYEIVILDVMLPSVSVTLPACVENMPRASVLPPEISKSLWAERVSLPPTARVPADTEVAPE